MEFDFSKATMIPLKDCLAPEHVVAPKFERRGCWIAQPSYEALSGWALQCRP